MVDPSVRWINGGTFVTNLQDKDRPVYEAAIKAHGDTNFYISDKPEPPSTQGASLHYTGDKRDLSAFWKIFYEIQRNNSE